MAKKKRINTKEVKLKKNRKKKTRLIEDKSEHYKLIENENMKLKQEIEELKQENKDLKENLLRKAADFENAKKIFLKDSDKRIENEKVKIFTELIEIIDNFDRAIEHLESSEDKDKVLEGIKMIDKHFHSYLEKFDIKKFISKGTTFDPSIHEAISVVSRNDAKDGEIVEEVSKGYKMKDKILRHAKVIVNQKNENNEYENND